MSDAVGAIVERVRANGIDFTCLRWGDGGRLALCLHGFPDDPGSMAPLASRMADAGYTVVAPYMRGYGPTGPAPDGGYTIGALGEDALSLADALDAEDPVLVGHDWGAVAGYAASMIDPTRFSHVVGMGTPPRFIESLLEHPSQVLRSWYMLFFQLPRVPERILPARNFALIEFLWRTWSPGWHYSDARIESVKRTFRTGGTTEAALAYYRQARQAGSEAGDRVAGASIGTPTLVVGGDRDGCIGPGLYEGAAVGVDARCRVVLVRGAGHFMHQEQVAVVTREIRSFVESEQ